VERRVLEQRLAKPYVVEETGERIFLDLANAPLAPEGALDFAARWGLLEGTEDEYEMSLGRFIELAEIMRRGVGHAAAAHARGEAPDYMSPVMVAFSVDLFVRRGRLHGDQHDRIYLAPKTLFDFCAAEFMQLLDADTEIRVCPWCGNFVAVGKVGTQPIYCSDACRKAAFRDRKKAYFRARRARRIVAMHDEAKKGRAREQK
jgi:hypothetical protein